MSLTDTATYVGIVFSLVTAMLYSVQIIESLSSFTFRSLNSARTKTLVSVAACSPTFNEFYRSLVSPNGAYRTGDRKEKYLLVFVTSSPAIVLAISTIAVATMPPLSGSALSNLLKILILFYPVALLLLVMAGALLIRRAVRIRRPTNSLIFIYSQLRGLNLYFLYLLAIYLITPLREVQETVAGVSSLAKAPTLAALLIVVLGIYVVLFLFFRLYKDKLTWRLEDRFYQWSPQRGHFTIELTISSGRNQPLEHIRGTILGMDQEMLLRRGDGLEQEISWKTVRGVAATPRDRPPAGIA